MSFVFFVAPSLLSDSSIIPVRNCNGEGESYFLRTEIGVKRRRKDNIKALEVAG